MAGLALVSCLAFVLVHLAAGRMPFLARAPRSGWLSAAGGVAVAYVFLHLLPELAGHQDMVAAAYGLGGGPSERMVYLLALAGVAAFYGLERLARTSARRESVARRDFWLHVGAFALYNAVIGYLLLHRADDGGGSTALYSVAMALHLLSNDLGLSAHHSARYDRSGRWVLAVSVAAGYAAGLVVAVPEPALGLVSAFLAGGVVLNALKEELPRERDSRFLPFLAGAGGFSALLLGL